jgi:leucyl-tRNA synthetase
VLFDLGLVKGDEPFTKLVHQGLILGTSYRYFRALEGDKRLIAGSAKVLRPTDPPEIRLAETKELVEELWAREDETVVRDNKTFHATLGVEVTMVAEKMSKSRGNVVNPDDIVKSHGADALRLYEMFMGPLEAVKPWQTSAIEGVRRFLDRTWNVSTNVTNDAATEETRRLTHKTIKKVTEDIEHMRFNTAISAMMILVKHLGALPATPRESATALVLLVSPFAPHIGEELWSRLGAQATRAYEPWPSFDADLVKDDVIEIGVQVNGKARASVQVAADADEESAKSVALADPKVQQFTTGKTIKKVIYVKGRILNFIVV